MYLLIVPLLLGGCAATTQVQLVGQLPEAAVCADRSETITALVLWGPGWRADQKDVVAREQAATQGLAEFFEAPDCFAHTELRRLPVGQLGSAEAAKAAAVESTNRARRVIYIVVRELGPVVKLFSSAAFIEGGTEVVLDIAAHDLRGGREARFSVHWRDGGAGVVKGVASLPADMRSALAAALRTPQPAR